MGSILMVGFVVILNVAISWWNCYVVGKSWDVVKYHGSWFDKLLLWSAAVQSAVGFSIPLLIGLSFVSVSFLTGGESPTLTPAEGAAFMEGIFSLWYIFVIVPILGSGLVIWIHSVREAIVRRDFSSIATAGWNTYANFRNFSNASSGIGQSFDGLGKFFSGMKGRDGKGALIVLLIMIVAVALLGGALATAMLIQHYRKESVGTFARA